MLFVHGSYAGNAWLRDVRGRARGCVARGVRVRARSFLTREGVGEFSHR